MYKSALMLLASAALFGAVSSAQAQIPAGNHYLCFQPKAGSQPVRKVAVSGPIGAGNLEAMQIVEICGSVRKAYNGRTYPIDDRLPYIVCYAVKPGEFKLRKLTEADQFGRNEMVISEPNQLCLPAAVLLN